MNTRDRSVILGSLLILTSLIGCESSREQGQDEVEILRDQWGIAHVYAEKEPALFFGYGYAMAEDRMFQMMLHRRAALGRLAEILGSGPQNQHIESDRRYRILGLEHLGKRMLRQMDEDTRKTLQAFADGINHYLDRHRGRLSPLFTRYGGHPESWHPAHSVVLWHFIGNLFMPEWEDEVLAKRGQLTRSTTSDKLKAEWPRTDDVGQIVSEEEFKRSYPDAYQRLKQIPKLPQQTSIFQPRPRDLKASQNWVVAPERSATGKAILQSDPQVEVRSPSFGYEAHLTGGRYNTRGWAIAVGAPGILVGWNENVAFGATALLGDHADLFEERINPENPDQYAWGEEWKKFEKRTEVIRVKDQDDLVFEVRRTHHGNVVTDLLQGVEEGEVYTLTSAASAAEKSTLEAVLKMMRAHDWISFREAMSQYSSPAPHIIYADVHDNIGYQTLVRTPVRDAVQRLPRQGWTGNDEWTMIPFELMPSMLNPRTNQIYTANPLPAGQWYPYPLGPARGVGPRAERLADIFRREGTFSVQDFITEVHRDAVNPTLRDFVIFAVAVMDEESITDPELETAVAKLREWDYQLQVDRAAYTLASGILSVLETEGVAEIWKMGYAGTEEGPSYMFRELMPEFLKTGKVRDDPQLRSWLKEYLVKGIALASSFDADVENGGYIHKMPYQETFMGLGSFAPEHDLESPPLKVRAIQTIWSPVGQNYAQIVDFSNLDQSLSLNPPGISENPSSPHFKDQLGIWSRGELHPAPISRAGVEKYTKSSTRLIYLPTKP